MRPNPHTFPMSMPFTHIDSSNSPNTPTKRKLPFPEAPQRSPPAGREQRETSSATPRLNPNPYSMATLPQPQQMALPTRNLIDRHQESLPTLRELLPEFSSYNTAPPPIGGTQLRVGPETFQPSGPTNRPAASGLAPSPIIATRQSAYSTPDTTPNVQQDRQYARSAPAESRNITTRNSPTDALRSLPPLSAGFPTTEPSRHPPYSSKSFYRGHVLKLIVAAPIPPAPYPGQMPPSLPLPQHFVSGSGHYGSPHVSYSQNPLSAGYAHYDNNDYGSDGKSRRRRGNLPKTVTDTLRKWFNEHIAHPYPTEDEKMMLMSATGLTMSQISNWFINARRRSLPTMSRESSNNVPAIDNSVMYPTDRGA